MSRKNKAKNSHGICCLCLCKSKLCDSHIIPEFFYKQQGLYDEKHRFHIISTEPLKHPPIAQKGMRERLLCKKCN